MYNLVHTRHAIRGLNNGWLVMFLDNVGANHKYLSQLGKRGYPECKRDLLRGQQLESFFVQIARCLEEPSGRVLTVGHLCSGNDNLHAVPPQRFDCLLRNLAHLIVADEDAVDAQRFPRETSENRRGLSQTTVVDGGGGFLSAKIEQPAFIALYLVEDTELRVIFYPLHDVTRLLSHENDEFYFTCIGAADLSDGGDYVLVVADDRDPAKCIAGRKVSQNP